MEPRADPWHSRLLIDASATRLDNATEVSVGKEAPNAENTSKGKRKEEGADNGADDRGSWWKPAIF